MSYNITELQSIVTFYELVDYANTYSSNALVGLFLIAIFVVLLMTLKRYDFSNAMIASSFITIVLAAVLSYIDLIDIRLTVIFIALAAIMALVVFMKKD